MSHDAMFPMDDPSEVLLVLHCHLSLFPKTSRITVCILHAYVKTFQWWKTQNYTFNSDCGNEMTLETHSINNKCLKGNPCSETSFFMKYITITCYHKPIIKGCLVSPTGWGFDLSHGGWGHYKGQMQFSMPAVTLPENDPGLTRTLGRDKICACRQMRIFSRKTQTQLNLTWVWTVRSNLRQKQAVCFGSPGKFNHMLMAPL